MGWFTSSDKDDDNQGSECKSYSISFLIFSKSSKTFSQISHHM